MLCCYTVQCVQCTVVSCNHSVCLFKALVVCRNAKAIWDIPQTLYTVQKIYMYMIDKIYNTSVCVFVCECKLF